MRKRYFVFIQIKNINKKIDTIIRLHISFRGEIVHSQMKSSLKLEIQFVEFFQLFIQFSFSLPSLEMFSISLY